MNLIKLESEKVLGEQLLGGKVNFNLKHVFLFLLSILHVSCKCPDLLVTLTQINKRNNVRLKSRSICCSFLKESRRK